MKKVIRLFLLGLLGFASVPAVAQTVYDLDQKEAGLNAKMTHIDQLELAYGQYLVARDQYFFGERGAYTLLNKWNQRLYRWTVGWQQTIAIMRRLSSYTDDSNRQALKSEFDAKTLEIGAILNDTTAIALRISEGRNVLAKIPALPGNLLATQGTDEYVARVNYGVERLGQRFNTLETLVGRDYINISVQLNGIGRDTLLFKMESAAYEFPELQGIADDLRMMVRAEDIILPAYIDVLNFADEAEIALIQNRFYAGRQALKLMQRVAFQKQQIIENESLSDSMKQWGKQKIQELVNERTTRFTNKANQLQQYQWVIAYFTDVLNRAGLECRKVQQKRYQFDCLLLRELQRLVKYRQSGGITVKDFEALKPMQEDMLTYLESSLDKVLTNGGVQEARR